jgi:hypothetical protein
MIHKPFGPCGLGIRTGFFYTKKTEAGPKNGPAAVLSSLGQQLRCKNRSEVLGLGWFCSPGKLGQKPASPLGLTTYRHPVPPLALLASWEPWGSQICQKSVGELRGTDWVPERKLVMKQSQRLNIVSSYFVACVEKATWEQVQDLEDIYVRFQRTEHYRPHWHTNVAQAILAMERVKEGRKPIYG